MVHTCNACRFSTTLLAYAVEHAQTTQHTFTDTRVPPITKESLTWALVIPILIALASALTQLNQ